MLLTIRRPGTKPWTQWTNATGDRLKSIVEEYRLLGWEVTW